MIKTYVTDVAVIFRKFGEPVGMLDYATLTLTIPSGVDAEDRQTLQYCAAGYVPGELRRFAGKVFTLGPKRDFTHEVTLHACGNPDMSQYYDIGPRMTVRCCGIDEAKKIVMDYQHRYEMGMGNCAKDHGIVWRLPLPCGGKRKNVGRVSYNGRYETVDEVKAWKAKIAAAFSKP